jgi:hypothetical protein
MSYTASTPKGNITNIPDDIEPGSPEFMEYYNSLGDTMEGGDFSASPQVQQVPQQPAQATTLPEVTQVQQEQPMVLQGPPKSTLETQRGDAGFNQPQSTELPDPKSSFVGFQQFKEASKEPFMGGLTPGAAGGISREMSPYLAAANIGGAIGGPPGAGGGAALYGATKLVADPMVRGLNLLTGRNDMVTSEFLASIFDKLGVARPQTKADQLVTNMAEGVADYGAMYGLGNWLKSVNLLGTNPGVGMKNFLTETLKLDKNVLKAVGKTLEAQPVRQAVATATGIGASGLTEEALKDSEMGPVKKMLATTGVGLLTDVATQSLMAILAKKAPMLRKKAIDGTPFTPKEKDVIKTLDSEGLKATAIEVQNVTGVKSKKRVNQITRRVSGGDDAGQQLFDRAAEVRDKVATVLDDADMPINTTELSKEGYGKKLLKEFSEKRGDEVKSLTKAKKEVITKLDTGKSVDTSEVVKYMQELATEYIDDSDLAPLAKKLNNWASEIDGKTFAQIEQKRSLIGSQLSGDVFKDMGSIPADIKKKVYAGVKKAQLEHIKKYGTKQDLSKWKYANGKLKLLVNDFQDKSISKIMDEAYNKPRNQTPETMINSLLNSEPSTVKKFMKRQTPKGRAVAEEYFIFDFMKHQEGNKLSGTALNKALRKRGEQLGIVIGQERLDVLNGAKKYFDYTAPSVEFADNFTGGGQKITGTAKVMGQSMQSRNIMDIALSPIVDRYAKWAERPAVRDILLKMDRLPPGSPKMAQLAKTLSRLNQQIAKYEIAKEEFNKNKRYEE